MSVDTETRDFCLLLKRVRSVKYLWRKDDLCHLRNIRPKYPLGGILLSPVQFEYQRLLDILPDISPTKNTAETQGAAGSFKNNQMPMMIREITGSTTMKSSENFAVPKLYKFQDLNVNQRCLQEYSRSSVPVLKPVICNFCKNNRESKETYRNHQLYDPVTKVLSCPVLRKHVCELCGCTGDEAHTTQYCPLNVHRGKTVGVAKLLNALTITNSTGKIRRH